MVMIYHCAFRRAGKPSRISAGAARYKRCRIKWKGTPCRFSYCYDDGKVDGKVRRGKD